MTTFATRPVGTRRPVQRRDPSRPELERFLCVVVRACLEVRSGRRPVSQLDGLVSPVVAKRLRRLLPRPGRTPVEAPLATAVRIVDAAWPAQQVCEATVLVTQAQRTTAMAVRAERHRGAWRIVELAAHADGLGVQRGSSARRLRRGPRDLIPGAPSRGRPPLRASDGRVRHPLG